MFERYEEKARRVIFFAHHETTVFGGAYIEPEHLLLGLFREWKWIASAIPPDAVAQLRSELEQRAANALRHKTSVDLPLSTESKRVLTYAAEEADSLNSKHIACGHLACGILRQTETFACQWLLRQGLTLERMRASMPEPVVSVAVNAATVRALEVILESASERLDWTVEPAVRFLLT
jgi:ATP-dependent Clp protease ATP-binding subunit ClpC